MAEPTGAAGAPPKGKGKGIPKKIAGVPTPIFAGGVAVFGGVLFIIWRKRKAKAAAAASAATTASVNSVASAEEAQIQSLEQELQQLISEEGSGGAAGGGGIGGGSVGGGAPAGGGGTVTSVGAVTTAATTTAATTASTGTTAPTGGDVAAPAGVSVTPYSTYADAGWGPNGTGYKYHYQVLPATGTTPIIDVQNSAANHVRLSPLKPSTSYRFRVSSETPRGSWTGYHAFKTKAA